MKSFSERLWEKIRKGNPEECWSWIASKSYKGYGRIGRNGKVRWAHREVYKDKIGSIPDNMCVCHCCDNPSCCNPKHLFLGTNADNVKDKVKKGRCHTYNNEGEKNGMAKLSAETVRNIRRMYATGNYRQRDIMKMFGIGRHHVYQIVHNKLWKSI